MLPQLATETEALVAARAYLERARIHIGAEASRAFVRETMLLYARSARGMLHLVELARDGEEDADFVLKEIAGELINRGEALPAFLGTYVAENLFGIGERRRGKKKKDYLFRDVIIASLVGDLSAYFALKPMRNRRSTRMSGCAIVAEALGQEKLAGLGEKAVERIYLRYWPAIRPTNPDYRAGWLFLPRQTS